MTPLYGILWPDNTYTGGITDKHALAAEYAKTSGFNGKAYSVGSEDDPELQPQVRKEPANIWRAP